jgi:hypothetical protein
MGNIGASISLGLIDQVTGGRLGTHDMACPFCGPFKRSGRNQRRQVLRVYRIEPNFAGYHCARCGAKGAVFNRHSAPPDPAKLAKARAEAVERERVVAAERLSLARWLWLRRRPIAGTIAEFYLRCARGYGGRLPTTLGFLPARGDHPPAMISAFGNAEETDAGALSICDTAVLGVHLTRLLPDGSGKAVETDEPAKIMIGYSTGSPIVLAPPNDGLGMVIAEGIEDTLSAHEATGLGAWAAGSAARMPALVDMVPTYIDCVTVFVVDDDTGRRHAGQFADGLRARGIETRLIVPRI